MIQEKILVMEYEIAINLQMNKEKMDAISELKKALKQIDYSTEIIPKGSYNRLTYLFESLLKRDLKPIEKTIVYELIEV